MPSNAEFRELDVVSTRTIRTRSGWQVTIVHLSKDGTRTYDETLPTRLYAQLADADVDFYTKLDRQRREREAAKLGKRSHLQAAE